MLGLGIGRDLARRNVRGDLHTRLGHRHQPHEASRLGGARRDRRGHLHRNALQLREDGLLPAGLVEGRLHDDYAGRRPGVGLRRLAQLRESGVISEAEFQEKKNDLQSRI